MKSIVACLVGMLALSGVAHAQSSAAPSPAPKGYVAGVAQSAFGNVTSQSFGAEGGVFLSPRLAVFVEAGMVRDTTPDSVGPSAIIIGGYLTQVQSAPVGFSAKQPVTFGQIGVRYSIPTQGRFEPYVLAAGGMGRVKRDVVFTVGGTDVTDNLGSYGVTLGSDLAGTSTKPMFTGGAGVVYKVGRLWQFDAGYRFSTVLTDTKSTNINRVGLAVGLRF